MAGVALACAVLGCASFKKQPADTWAAQKAKLKQAAAQDTARTAEHGNAAMVLEKSNGPRKPSAAFCVALGNLKMDCSNEPERTPAHVEQFRDQARKIYQKALEIDPKNIPAHLAMARLYETIGDRTQALVYYHKAIKLAPKDGSIRSELGWSHARAKEWDTAIENLRIAVSLDPENRQYGKTLGFLLARAGRFEDSLSQLKKVYKSEAEAHYNIACMLYQLNQDEASKQHLRQALLLDPKLEDAQHLLASLDTPPGVIHADHPQR